jgi:MarR family transcriptional regulator, organic hydroperoxide resistance regulator
MPTTLPLSQQACFALYSTSLAMTKVYKPLLVSLKLTYPQYLVMLALWERDARMVSEIGDALFLDSGTLTPLLKKLQAMGYVLRQRSEMDERCVVIELTAAGRALQKKAAPLSQCVADASGCTATELTSLTARLQSLRTSLHNSLRASLEV